MPRDDLRRIRRARSTPSDSNADHTLELQSLLQQTYRQLEHAYHCSPEYGRMVERYPVLARAIASCHQQELVGDPAPCLRLGARLISGRDRSGGSRRTPPSP